MKTNHFEGRIALSAADAAQERDEPTQCEIAAFDIDFVGAWLVAPADCAGTGHQPGDRGQVSAAGSLKTSHSDPRLRSAKFLPSWQSQIEAAVAVGLSAQRIYQDLVTEHGFSGKLPSGQTQHELTAAGFEEVEKVTRFHGCPWALGERSGCTTLAGALVEATSGGGGDVRVTSTLKSF